MPDAGAVQTFFLIFLSNPKANFRKYIPDLEPPMIVMSQLRFISASRIARIAGLTMAVAAFASGPLAAGAQRDGRGSWRIQNQDSDGRIQLVFEDYDGSNHSSSSYPVSIGSLEGMTISQLRGSSSDSHFRMHRDAGTFTFDGRVGSGRGAGQFSFAADPRFAQQLSARGYGRPDSEQQFQMAMFDVGYSLIDELKAQGYSRPSVDDLVNVGMHGARYEFVHGLAQLGYRLKDIETLVDLRDHRVSRDFITAIASMGYSGLSTDDL